MKIGIVSEIRTATLINSENPYIKYPCKVVVHIMERATDGSILSCTVSDGGCFVTARRAKFADMSEELPVRCQHLNTYDILGIERPKPISVEKVR